MASPSFDVVTIAVTGFCRVRRIEPGARDSFERLFVFHASASPLVAWRESTVTGYLTPVGFGVIALVDPEALDSLI